MIRVIRIIHRNLIVLVVAAFTKKEERKRQRKHTHIHTQSSTEYCRVRMRIILSLCFVYMSICDLL